MNDQGQHPRDWEEKAEARVRDILGSFREDLRDRPSHEDLISSRVIDSLIFVSLLSSLADRSGRDVDFDRIGGAQLRTINGLARVFFGPADSQSVTVGP